jgi:hypothetical protein
VQTGGFVYEEILYPGHETRLRQGYGVASSPCVYHWNTCSHINFRGYNPNKGYSHARSLALTKVRKVRKVRQIFVF